MSREILKVVVLFLLIVATLAFKSNASAATSFPSQTVFGSVKCLVAKLMCFIGVFSREHCAAISEEMELPKLYKSLVDNYGSSQVERAVFEGTLSVLPWQTTPTYVNITLPIVSASFAGQPVDVCAVIALAMVVSIPNGDFYYLRCLLETQGSKKNKQEIAQGFEIQGVSAKQLTVAYGWATSVSERRSLQASVLRNILGEVIEDFVVDQLPDLSQVGLPCYQQGLIRCGACAFSLSIMGIALPTGFIAAGLGLVVDITCLSCLEWLVDRYKGVDCPSTPPPTHAPTKMPTPPTHAPTKMPAPECLEFLGNITFSGTSCQYRYNCRYIDGACNYECTIGDGDLDREYDCNNRIAFRCFLIPPLGEDPSFWDWWCPAGGVQP